MNIFSDSSMPLASKTIQCLQRSPVPFPFKVTLHAMYTAYIADCTKPMRTYHLNTSALHQVPSY
uniref:Uncharacterized protein n=1 Tax=Populus trichocarpa TaxID=3694 RepID=A9PFP1_POPTR|nr:unknown [Populus trichocarpa]